ncbi:MAG: penicillin-insensitive murein endopeptidase [Acidobacteriota bacterium]
MAAARQFLTPRRLVLRTSSIDRVRSRPFLWAVVALAASAAGAGCAELGVVTDGTSISVGKPSHGYLLEGTRLPDHGAGFTTRKVWLDRQNRYGTDELVDLVMGVARRMHAHVKGVQLVVADLSAKGGGVGGISAFHRSHQSGRDADLLPYMRDAEGKPFEPDAMHKFDWRGRATDGSGITLDVPRTWLLVKELVSAPEAPVQYIFMYEPLAQMLIDHAKQIGEPMAVIIRARRALRQPGDSARHDDHMHVRVYCSADDRAYGCMDIGPMDLLAQWQAEQQSQLAAVAGVLAPDDSAAASAPAVAAASSPASHDTWRDQLEAAGVAPAELPSSASETAATAGMLGVGSRELRALGSRLRAGTDRALLRSWR